MIKQDFIKIIQSQLDWNDKITKLENILQTELYMSDMYSHPTFLFEYIIRDKFTKDGEDIIYTYIYEEGERDLEYLWNKVKDYRK